MCRNKQRLAESNTLTNYTGYYTYFLTIPCLPQAWTNVSLSSVIWSDVSHLLMIITIFTYSLMDYFLWLIYRKFRIFWVIEGQRMFFGTRCQYLYVMSYRTPGIHFLVCLWYIYLISIFKLNFRLKGE